MLTWALMLHGSAQGGTPVHQLGTPRARREGRWQPSVMQTRAMTAHPATVSVDDLRAAGAPAASWNEAVRRVERGETVAVVDDGQHVADVVPADELDRLRETIDVLADTEAVRAPADAEPVVVGRDAIRSLVAKRQG